MPSAVKPEEVTPAPTAPTVPAGWVVVVVGFSSIPAVADMAEKFFDILEESSPSPPGIKRKLDVEVVDTGKHVKDVRTRGRVVCVQLLFSLPDLRDHSMLRGMTGYQLTPEDMEFLKTMLEEKMVAKLKVAAVAVLWRHWYQN